MPQVPKNYIPKQGADAGAIPRLLPSTNYEPNLPRKLPNLPGVTVVIVRPYAQARAQGELARTKQGPEVTIRVNKIDKQIMEEGAKLCGLRMADYVRQCALHTTQALKAQTANEPHTRTDPGTTGIPEKP